MKLAEKLNRLINEKIPYLLQHAYNPVDWYPWSEEAFIKVREENKPVFCPHKFNKNFTISNYDLFPTQFCRIFRVSIYAIIIAIIAPLLQFTCSSLFWGHLLKQYVFSSCSSSQNLEHFWDNFVSTSIGVQNSFFIKTIHSGCKPIS